jgi:hypothetical protein
MIPLCVLFWMLGSHAARAQNSGSSQAKKPAASSSHSLLFSPQFIQIKDAFNYGLVYSGLNLELGYAYRIDRDKSRLTYEAELGFAGVWNKGGGMAWHFKAADLSYGLRINPESALPVYIGPYAAVNYRWQRYPELQGGHLFWFTAMEFGPEFTFEVPLGERGLRFRLATSLAGWTSRPEPATESHFYSSTFSDFITNAHQDLQFGSLNVFDHTDFEVEWWPAETGHFSIAYAFEYFGYFKDPEVRYLEHALLLKWKFGKPSE